MNCLDFTDDGVTGVAACQAYLNDVVFANDA